MRRINMGFMIICFINNSRCLAITAGYSSLLNDCGISIDTSIEWFYNSYIQDTFSINGFSIALPQAAASFFERCKSIGPEIERVIKAFTLLVEDGDIDHNLFPFTPINDFGHISSFIKNKYIFPGKAFDAFTFSFLSDQSLLNAPKDIESNYECAFDLFVEQNLAQSVFHDFQWREIDWLIDLGLLLVDKDSFLKPTFASNLLKKVWLEGVLTPCRLPNEACVEISRLVDGGLSSVFQIAFRST